MFAGGREVRGEKGGGGVGYLLKTRSRPTIILRWRGRILMAAGVLTILWLSMARLVSFLAVISNWR